MEIGHVWAIALVAAIAAVNWALARRVRR